jgi:site-specific DNA-methyltransferase (adenine-specific)
MSTEVINGDCLEVLRGLDDNTVDAIVTDPPAGIAFMGKAWDKDKGGRQQWVAWLADVLSEAQRVAKPGAHALVWALPRTSHWTGTAIELGGWDVRDCLCHIFGSGFPKSMDVSKAIDAAAGAEREIIGFNAEAAAKANKRQDAAGRIIGRPINDNGATITAPATPDAIKWDGWGTAIKPAMEHWYLARAPFKGTVAANVLEHGTGALNVDGCRVATSDDTARARVVVADTSAPFGKGYAMGGNGHDSGRFPPNLLLSHAPVVSGGRVGPAERTLDVDARQAPSERRTWTRLRYDPHRGRV